MLLKMMAYKLVFFDVDGTLVQELKEKMLAHTGYIEPHEFEDSIWVTLHRYFKTTNEAREQYKEFHDGILSYKNWVEKNVALWEERGADREKMEKAFAEFTVQTTGAEETIRELKQAGIALAVLSGGLKQLVEHHYPSEFSPVFANDILYDEKGAIVGSETTPYDFGGKLRGLREVCRIHGVQLSETVYVGDNINDFQAMEEVGLGIAFNSKSEALNKAADVVITKRDLREILPHILGERS